MAVVTRRTGLGADVIRAWERRHRAVEPARSPGNHRLYTDDDIRRLLLIRQALEAGWHIGQVASLSDTEIEKLVEGAVTVVRRTGPFEPFLRRCLERIEELDEEGLRLELESASAALARIPLLEGLLAPLLERIGSACASGRLRIAHEHLASAAVRSFLESLRGAYHVPEDAPAVVVATPPFQHHELGAMLVAATARSEGWRTIYLGPNLPSEEVAAVAASPGVRILALSIAFDASDSALDAELRKLGRLIPDEVRIVVGGRASGGYLGALDEMGASRISDLRAFRDFLARERA
jgi:DNA-binding transcriptional MerR regulator/methylmalonyl-CoA mutase cobalamin-binding subunit